MPNPTIIRLDHVSKTYQNGDSAVEALKDVSLEIEKGTVTCITGKSGCGKTTLLEIIAGLLDADQGRVQVLGSDLSLLSTRQKMNLRLEHFAMIFEGNNFIQEWSLEKNCQFIRSQKGLDQDPVQLKNLFEQIHLSPVMCSRPGTLSSGALQKAALARAIYQNPSVILADEPTGSLDRINTREMAGLLQAVQKDQNLTMIIVSHDLDFARQFDRILYMEEGRIVFEKRKS